MDVYADWVDACDAVAKEDGAAADGAHDKGPTGDRPRARNEDDDDDIIDDEDDEVGYGGEGAAADDEY